MKLASDTLAAVVVELSEQNLRQLRQQLEWHVEDPGQWPRVMLRKTTDDGRVLIVEVTPDAR